MYIVTGMHRSGTSIISRLIYLSGGDLGDFNKLFPGDKWNPDGYFEQIDILLLNISLVNGPWGKLSYISLPSEELILKRAKKFLKKAEKLSASHKNKIVKDPRFCLTIPVWQTCENKIEKVIVNMREPIQVAHSLNKRNHFPIKMGLNVWYEHNHRLLRYIEKIPFILMNYHKLLDPDFSFIELSRVLNFLNIENSEKEIRSILKNYIKPSLNHNQITNYDYEVKIKDLWDKMQYLHSSQ